MITEYNIPRFNHSLACGRMFNVLQAGNTNTELCYILGLFHDIAHSWSYTSLIDFINKNNIELLENEAEDTMLLHAPIGSFFLKKEFPNLDSHYINALRYHTCPVLGLGDAELNFYVADKIDDTRSHISTEFRNMIINEKNAEIRALHILRMQKDYLTKKSKTFIPATEKFYSFLESKYVGL